MVETLIDKPAKWLEGSGPEAAAVVFSQGSLVRNLADYPFPARCNDEDLRTAEERILAAVESAGLLSQGQYYSLPEASKREAQFFLERQLINEALLHGRGARGVFVSEEQSLSIMVNEANHLRITATASGLDLDTLWTRLSATEETLASSLDFAFDDRLGYLTAALGQVGTGLILNAVTHLPGLARLGRVLGLEQRIRDQRHVLQALFGSINEPVGDLYRVSNQATLGRSEEEIVYHLRHITRDILKEEQEARNTMIEEGRLSLEDRVNRALGSARGARLLELGEALDVLSSLRLGHATGYLEGFTCRKLNELLIETQPAHLELRQGSQEGCDDVTLSVARANLYRAHLS